MHLNLPKKATLKIQRKKKTELLEKQYLKSIENDEVNAHVDGVLESESEQQGLSAEESEVTIDDSHLEVIQLDTKRDLSDYLLFTLSAILLVLAIIAFYYRNPILKYFISGIIVPTVYAQSTDPTDSLVKKKRYLS